jgi:hypothetical protein
MKKALVILVPCLCVFFGAGSPAWTDETATELDQLKQEVNRLLKRIEELEKKQTETEQKAAETQKKVAEVEEKAEKGEKKALKDRVHLSGEARFRVMSSWFDTSAGFYGGHGPEDALPETDQEWRDETSFPVRVRLNLWAEVVPEIVDFYGRLTMNKRWGAWDPSIGSSSNPFDKPNSFESSIGHDVTLRAEQAYATFKIPSIRSTWYVGRLPGLDGPPSRQTGSLFPRLFIDSEIDGTLLKWEAPATGLDEQELPWTRTRLWGGGSPEAPAGGAADGGPPKEFPSRKAFEAKAKEKSGILVGYLKYDEKKESLPDDADAFLAQGLLKIGKSTSVIADGLYMDDWHMPYGSSVKASGQGKPEVVTTYTLTGVYADTQLLGFQVYGAYYHSHFRIPAHTWSTSKASGSFAGADFPGHIWYLGFNTGDLLGARHQFTAEYAQGSDAWINPFNYRGYRRKGTVLSAADNAYYEGATVVGFYPFNAGVWDVYYDYFFRSNVRFRVGFLYFDYDKHTEHTNEAGFSILGSSKYETLYWPYGEFNLSF